MIVDPRWYESFFDDDWLAITLDREADRTPGEIDLLSELLALEPGARILDAGCGHGRHSLELARRGFDVTGIDLSEPSLAIARARAAEAGVAVEYHHGDALDMSWDGEFDGAITLFSTILGYFPEEGDDARFLSNLARALKSGGKLVLDTLNPVGLFSGGYLEHSWHELADGRLVVEEHRYDVRSGRTTAHWLVFRPDGSRGELSHSMRLYTMPELERLLGAAGLAVTDVRGGWDGVEADRTSRRLIVCAELA
jgi:2-polyprenyl-3-methyl-5-hydroxy-6-metoxy-1,4-benzoquinol methylase